MVIPNMRIFLRRSYDLYDPDLALVNNRSAIDEWERNGELTQDEAEKLRAYNRQLFRKATRCPVCKSSHIDNFPGWFLCRDCGYNSEVKK